MPIENAIARGMPDLGAGVMPSVYAAQQNQRRNAFVDQQTANMRQTYDANARNALVADQDRQAAQQHQAEIDHARESYQALVSGDAEALKRLRIDPGILNDPVQLKATTEVAFATGFSKEYAGQAAKNYAPPKSLNGAGFEYGSAPGIGIYSRKDGTVTTKANPRSYVFQAQIDDLMAANPGITEEQATNLVLRARKVQPEPGGTGQNQVIDQLAGTVTRQPNGPAPVTPPPIATPQSPPPYIAAPGVANAPTQPGVFGGASQIAGVVPKVKSGAAVVAGMVGLGDIFSLANDPNKREYLRQKAPLIEKQVAAALAAGAFLSGSRGNSSTLIKQYQEAVHMDNAVFDSPELLQQRMVAIRDQLVSTKQTAEQIVANPSSNAAAFKNAQDTIMAVNAAFRQMGVSPNAVPGNVSGNADPDVEALVQKYLGKGNGN